LQADFSKNLKNFEKFLKNPTKTLKNRRARNDSRFL